MPVIVAAREKILDHEAYNSASSSPVDEYDEVRDDVRDAGHKDAVPVPA